MKFPIFTTCALLMLGTILVTSGCDDKIKAHQSEVVKQAIQNNKVTVDGCEYAWVAFDRSISFSHLGTCKNPIHRTNSN